ncbi:MAG: c-type cytochrome [Bosea sp.]|uniref:cytochrome-c peroxidase n=1 Tax=Bosea sp. (in: a-proteobacteria) TaxID=1871050 RepID=UPI00239BFF64|nr:c-type cytochrome [Bosea sp. (in: a-proteobacteria)]MCP4737586.1 c-type cytochrome [Bosea sp. (in: a-proteobacteria)]
MAQPAAGMAVASPRLRGWRLLAGVAMILLAGCSTIEPLIESPASLDSDNSSLTTEQAEQKARAAARALDIAGLRAKYRRPSELPNGARASAPVVALGDKLFHSTELSGNRRIACVSCHLPNAAWADRKAKPIADNGRPMTRRSQTLYDMAWASAFLWDGRQDSLAGMVSGPIASPDIMGLSLDAMVQRLAFSPEFSADFQRVYPNVGPTPETVSDALAGYMNTLRSPATRFDRWVKGDERALSPAELRGFKLFNGKANCVACHSGWRFTDEGFRDIGLTDTSDRGRGRIKPQIESLAFAFKTPTLRGVADRAPYMHDGSVATLEAVVEHYDRGGVRRPSLSPDMFPLGLSAQEKNDLVAFMRSLSGPATSIQTNADPEATAQ